MLVQSMDKQQRKKSDQWLAYLFWVLVKKQKRF